MTQYKKVSFLSILLTITCFFAASGQDASSQALVLTLEEAIQLAQTNSHDARIARSEFLSAEWDFKAYRSSYLPALSLNGSAPGFLRSFDNITQNDGTLSFVEQRRTFSQMNFSVSQPLTMTGGTLNFSSGLNYLDQQGTFSSQEWQSNPFSVTLFQPLFQFNAMKWDRIIEPMQYELAKKSYIEQIAEIETEVADLFFAVYDAQKSIEIASFNVAVNDTIFTLSQGRFEIGRIAENDLLQSEYQLINAQTEQANATINYERALRDLKTVLDLPYNLELSVIPPLETPTIDVDPDIAVELARRYRPAFTNLELQQLFAEQEVEQARKSQRNVNLTASYGLNQNSESFNNVFVDPLEQQRFSVSFQVPIFQWGARKSRLNAALEDQDRVEEEQILLEKQFDQTVYFQVKQLQLLEQQVEIAAQADTIATRRFEVARNRYLVGNIDITELFNAQREKDQANRAFILTLRQFWTSLYTLRRLTLFDFSQNLPLSTPSN